MRFSLSLVAASCAIVADGPEAVCSAQRPRPAALHTGTQGLSENSTGHCRSGTGRTGTRGRNRLAFSNQLRGSGEGRYSGSGYFSDALRQLQPAACKSLGLDGALRAVGVNPEAAGRTSNGPAQKTLSVIGGAMPCGRRNGPGSAITDGKIEQFIHTQPGIMTDPQALQRIMAWARSQYTYDREMGHAATELEAAKKENAGRLPPEWVAAYYRDHGFAPIYNQETGEMQQPDGRQPARETPAAQGPVVVNSPQDAQSLPLGTTYKTPDGRTLQAMSDTFNGQGRKSRGRGRRLREHRKPGFGDCSRKTLQHSASARQPLTHSTTPPRWASGPAICRCSHAGRAGSRNQ